MKKVFMLLTAIVFNCICGGVFASVAGITPVWGALGANAIGVVATGTPGLHAGLYTEVWTGELIKKFRALLESYAWIDKVPSYDQYAQNDIIHLVDVGADPAVLIDNTSYPIAITALADSDITIKLRKFQTEATPITDDELRALSYDKIPLVLEKHKEKIIEEKIKLALHSFAPAGNTASTPVLLTTGGAIGTTRNKIQASDIIALKAQFDAMKVPVVGRILVLCTDHVQDLLLEDRVFQVQYNNYTTGKIANMYGFEVYEYVDCPYYVVSTKTKLAFNGVPGATHRQASVAFYAPRMFKATGSTTIYQDEPNTTMQRSLINIRHYFVALPKKNEAIGAIVSAIPPPPPSGD